MDIPWGSPESKAFATNVGLITSYGPYGHDIMAAEWTHHISYAPGLLAVCINFRDATNANITATKEFGVSLCAADQSILSSIAGGSTGKEVDKIKVLQELGYKLTPSKTIKPSLVDGAVLQLECKLIQHMNLGDHTMFVGEVVEKNLNPAKTPLVYHSGKYWTLGTSLPKPSEAELAKIHNIITQHTKKQ